jgi:hypothetical protein
MAEALNVAHEAVRVTFEGHKMPCESLKVPSGRAEVRHEAIKCKPGGNRPELLARFCLNTVLLLYA